MSWKEIDNYEDLPAGVWLVKTSSEHFHYHVADVSVRPNGKFIVVGGHFHYDQEPIIAYTSFDGYDETIQENAQ